MFNLTTFKRELKILAFLFAYMEYCLYICRIISVFLIFYGGNV